MRILLVNDDGYEASGLLALKEILQSYGEVYVVAPSTGKSGAGCSLTTFKPIKIHKIDEKNYHVEGTPVDCVQFAKAQFPDFFDLVVSGCNRGFNVSNDVLYSGTCGGGFQALMFKTPSICFSQDYIDDPWQVRNSGKEVLDFIFSNNLLSKDYFLNVNFPFMEYKKPKGIVITKLYVRDTSYSISEKDEEGYQIISHVHDIPEDISTFDVSAIRNGYISITPISVTAYKEEHYKELVVKVNK